MDEVSALMHLMAKGGVEFRAKKKVIVEVPIEVHSSDNNKGKFKVTHRGSQAQSLTKLECDPFTAWIKTLHNNPNVIWKGVEEEHKQWSHKSQGMTPAAQAILAVALSVVTGGVGGVLIGAAGSLTGMMASAAFTSLVSQATVSMINNQGNLSQVVKDLTTSQAMISTLTSMAGAGISHEFGLSSLNTKTFTDHLQNAGVQCIAPTTVSVLRNPNLKEALKQGLLDIGVAAVGSYGAKQIGGLYHPSDSKTPPISYIQHKFLHGLLGAAMGTALSKDRKLGALSGGFGAIASETIAEYITPSPEELYQGIVDDHRKRGVILTERGLQKSYTQAIQLRADISRMTTATLLLLAKGDITVGDITGSNALQNNFQPTHSWESEMIRKDSNEIFMEKATQEIPEFVEFKEDIHSFIDWMDEKNRSIPILNNHPLFQISNYITNQASHGLTDLFMPTTGLDLGLLFAGPTLKVPGVVGKGVGLLRKGKIKPVIPQKKQIPQKNPQVKTPPQVGLPVNNNLKALDLSIHTKALNAPRMADHHIFPQQFRKFFEQKGIDIDKFTVTVGKTTHLKGLHGKGNAGLPGKWNKRWLTFIEENPNVSTSEVYQFGGKLMDEYKLNNLHLHEYKK